VSAQASEATEDYSKGPLPARVPAGALRAALGGLGAVGAIVLLVGEFTPVVEIVVGSLSTVQRRVDGGDNHGHALLVVALAALPLAWIAARGIGPARPAALGLAALGLVALVVALTVDLPDTRRSGNLPESVAFESARARAGDGLTLEIAGGALLLVSGGLLAAPGPRGPRT
jgi:hypothetical protein